MANGGRMLAVLSQLLKNKPHTTAQPSKIMGESFKVCVRQDKSNLSWRTHTHFIKPYSRLSRKVNRSYPKEMTKIDTLPQIPEQIAVTDRPHA
jgi:hypothetical protein